MPERLAKHGPADAALADVHRLAAPIGVSRIEQVVFHVNFCEETVERENPLLRWREPHVIPDVEVSLDPRALERFDEVAKDLRLNPQVVPDVLERDDDLGFLGQRNQPLDRFSGSVRSVIVAVR